MTSSIASCLSPIKSSVSKVEYILRGKIVMLDPELETLANTVEHYLDNKLSILLVKGNTPNLVALARYAKRKFVRAELANISFFDIFAKIQVLNRAAVDVLNKDKTNVLELWFTRHIRTILDFRHPATVELWHSMRVARLLIPAIVCVGCMLTAEVTCIRARANKAARKPCAVVDLGDELPRQGRSAGLGVLVLGDQAER